MNFYNRWQSLNLIQNLSEFVSESLEQPLSKGSLIIGAQIVYAFGLFIVITLLRKDSSRDN